ncbi:hypothetical protein [uncultured Ruegeria sp.]|uniref:hypothetical protein n=1 Tax=uncultured Ruegeria sp. TaxID=259304 RepID=UPI0026234407|nr:hypothetical protein [uncultured Ruegeria sp.]
MKLKEKNRIQTVAFWEATVVWTGALTFGLAIWLMVWLFKEDAKLFSDKLEVAWRLMVIAGSLLTFLTIVWRGSIATQQVEQQRLQLASITKQIAQTEHNNLANLLEKGVNLVSEEERQKFEAGLILITHVATSGDSQLSLAAFNMLSQFTQNLQYQERPHLYKLASRYMEKAREAHGV